jgi:hypothetical protein
MGAEKMSPAAIWTAATFTFGWTLAVVVAVGSNEVGEGISLVRIGTGSVVSSVDTTVPLVEGSLLLTRLWTVPDGATLVTTLAEAVMALLGGGVSSLALRAAGTATGEAKDAVACKAVSSMNRNLHVGAILVSLVRDDSGVAAWDYPMPAGTVGPLCIT